MVTKDEIKPIVDFVMDLDALTGIDSEERDRIETAVIEGYKAGMRKGIWLFAWWKDGVQYVGTTGKTLKQALEEINSKPNLNL